MTPEADTNYEPPINPPDMVVPPQDKPVDPATPEPIGVKDGDPRAPSQLGFDTPQYGTETPYRKTPPTNIGSVAEAAATGTPPTAAGVSQDDANDQLTPVCTTAPAVTGTPTSGQTLTCGNGTWSPAATAYDFQWYQYPDTVLAGKTANTLVLAAGNVGTKVFCRVKGKTTAGGSSPADSNIVGPVA